MIKGCALSSGSSGNCFLIETDSAFLVDAGLSCKKIVELLGKAGRDPSKIDGIFITHEHQDHIRGADLFSRKFGVPVFINNDTYNSHFFEEEDLLRIINNNETIELKNTKITAFQKSHSAADPVGFCFEYKNKKASVITDFGYACDNVIQKVRESNMLFIESNHDLEMLDNGPYPPYLKKWIKSKIGHMSNYDTSMLILEHASSKLKKVVLSHLSENNNTPEAALEAFKLIKERKDLRGIEVLLSLREEPTSIIHV